jgi:hypothetical protein
MALLRVSVGHGGGVCHASYPGLLEEDGLIGLLVSTQSQTS